MRRGLAILFIVILVAIGGFLLYVTVKPLGAETLASQPNPASFRTREIERGVVRILLGLRRRRRMRRPQSSSD